MQVTFSAAAWIVGIVLMILISVVAVMAISVFAYLLAIRRRNRCRVQQLARHQEADS